MHDLSDHISTQQFCVSKLQTLLVTKKNIYIYIDIVYQDGSSFTMTGSMWCAAVLTIHEPLTILIRKWVTSPVGPHVFSDYPLLTIHSRETKYAHLNLFSLSYVQLNLCNAMFCTIYSMQSLMQMQCFFQDVIINVQLSNYWMIYISHENMIILRMYMWFLQAQRIRQEQNVRFTTRTTKTNI